MRADRVPVVLLSLASDGRLAELVGLGSERAFEELFERHHRPVLAFCAHMLGSWEEAEDAAQQAFVAAYGELARGNRPRALRPWLYGVARHRCLAALEARRARPDTGVAEPSVDALLRHVAVREDLRAILADVAGLPEDQRAALVLAELGGLAHGEIAPILGCRPDKVRALVFQARSSLATGRAARDTPCAVVREQLATLNGAALRRRVLRRHLRDCADCRAYRERANGRSRALGLLLPAVSAAGLKRAVLGSVLGSGGGGAGGGALIAACVGGSGGLAATALVVV